MFSPGLFSDLYISLAADRTENSSYCRQYTEGTAERPKYLLSVCLSATSGQDRCQRS